ncbi:hypothetical protein D9758_008291 [Tetrapyrgos nigripes]|uniref:Potassium channel domain-containing protein n=1 Tax=Tetrapyrgos nigripes TaxID=182062 RepID=A0A8H5G1F7_9AGAR|nr:hypothetical protein D9758_008291 [Tetrapyrgos nigripes]
MNSSKYEEGNTHEDQAEGERREGNAGSAAEEEGRLLSHPNDETDHDELDELDDEEDTNSTGNAATIAHSFISNPPRWWTRLKEFLYPDTDDEDTTTVPNYRYTPIISGVTIPFAILLEIPGLTEHWYIRTVNNQTVETRPNTVLLDVGLALSMACALLANVALVTRFLERRVKTMTFICVVSLSIHDIINITAVTVFGVEHRHDDGFTYGQSFWMTVCSTVASTITNATLIYDLIQTPEFATSGSGLTRKQRSLIIIVIILLCYIALGAFVHCLLTDLTFIDALYFTICCIETIGFGDITMTTTGSKIFTCLYSVIGILNLALAVSLTRETVIEALEVSYRKRMEVVGNRRRRMHWARRVGRRWMSAVSWRLRESGKDVWVWDDEVELHEEDDDVEAPSLFQKLFRPVIKCYRFFRRSIPHLVDRALPYQGTWEPSDKSPLWDIPHPHGMHLNLEALTDSQLEAAAMEAGVPLVELVPEKVWEKREKKARKEKERREKKLQKEKGKEKEKNPGRDAGAEGEKRPSSPQGGLSPQNHTPSAPSSTSPLRRPTNQRNRSSGLAYLPFWFDKLKRAQSEINPEEVPLTHARLGRMIGMLGAFGMAFSLGRWSPVAASADARKSDINGHAGPSDAKPTSSDGFDMDAAYRQKRLKEEAAEEERKAFYAQLSVVWTLFLVFWMVGSAVFTVTENWSFGNAMYFCVVAFTTIGFGDFSPHSPAGRSFFVVWALLGVATMTILISVIGEAYTTRYRTVLQSSSIPGFFDKAVTKYRMKERERMLLKSEARTRQNDDGGFTHELDSVPAETRQGQKLPDEGTAAAQDFSSHLPHEHSKPRARLEKLENLPNEILHHAKSFQEHVQYFFHGGMDKHREGSPDHSGTRLQLGGSVGLERTRSNNDSDMELYEESSRLWDNHRKNMPEELRELLDDVVVEHFGESSARRAKERLAKIEREILSDEETRRVLFVLGIERSFRKMIEAAEEALESLAERDRTLLPQNSGPSRNGQDNVSTD